MAAGTSSFEIPIFGMNLDNSYRYMANGRMEFKADYPKGAYVVFKIHLNQDKTIEMEAWTSDDEEGFFKKEKGVTSIVMGKYAAPVARRNIAAASGEVVPNGGTAESPKALVLPIPGMSEERIDVRDVFGRLSGHCRKSENLRSSNAGCSAQIRKLISQIIAAANRDEVLNTLMTEFRLIEGCGTEYKTRLFIIGRRLAGCMNDSQKNTMAKACMHELRSGRTTFYINGPSVNSTIQAIYTLGVCGSKSDLAELEKYHNRSNLNDPLLYTHARTKTCVEWVYDAFREDVRKNKSYQCNHLGQTLYAIGLAMYNDGRPVKCSASKGKVVTAICNLINEKMVPTAAINVAVLAIGWICDQRYKNDISPETLAKAKDTIEGMGRMYPTAPARTQALRNMLRKVLSGAKLTEAEEKLLLEQLNK